MEWYDPMIASAMYAIKHDFAKRFVGLNEEQKSYIVGYMNGVQEERARW